MGENGCIQKISCVFKGNRENYLQAKQRVANSEKLLTSTVCSLWRTDFLWSRPSQKAPIWFFTANNRAHWSRFQQKEHLLNDIGTSTFRKVELMYFFLFLPLSTNKNHRHYVLEVFLASFSLPIWKTDMFIELIWPKEKIKWDIQIVKKNTINTLVNQYVLKTVKRGDK